MMATNYPLTPGSLASNCYPADPQTLYNEMFAQGFVQLDIQGVVVSATEPDPDDRDKLWIQLDGSSNPVRHWIFANGVWRWPHEVPASSNERRLWVESESALETYDGGSAGTVSAITGPFWEVDHDFDQRVPIGPGTLPESGTSISVGDTGGVDQFNLSVNQTPEHSHLMFRDTDASAVLHTQSNPDEKSVARSRSDGGSTQYQMSSGGDAETNPAEIGRTSEVGDGEGDSNSINNMPPYRGIFLIKRTSRIYRTV